MIVLKRKKDDINIIKSKDVILKELENKNARIKGYDEYVFLNLMFEMNKYLERGFKNKDYELIIPEEHYIINEYDYSSDIIYCVKERGYSVEDNRSQARFKNIVILMD